MAPDAPVEGPTASDEGMLQDVRPYSAAADRTMLQGVDDSILIEQLRALGDPVRWSIVGELRAGTLCACRLAEVAGVSPGLLSHHLKVLRGAGFITGERRGRWIDYTLVPSALEQLTLRLSPSRVPAT